MGVATVAATCGGGYTSPTPTPSPNNPYRVTISATGAVSPVELVVPPGTRVLFINNDARRHDMTSDSAPRAHRLSGAQSGGPPHDRTEPRVRKPGGGAHLRLPRSTRTQTTPRCAAALWCAEHRGPNEGCQYYWRRCILCLGSEDEARRPWSVVRSPWSVVQLEADMAKKKRVVRRRKKTTPKSIGLSPVDTREVEDASLRHAGARG